MRPTPTPGVHKNTNRDEITTSFAESRSAIPTEIQMNKQPSIRTGLQHQKALAPRGLSVDLTLSSIYEVWLVTTFTAYVGKDIWVGEISASAPIPARLAFKPGRISMADMCWLVEDAFKLALGKQSIRRASEPEGLARTDPSAEFLVSFAENLRLYLNDFDVTAMAKDLYLVDDRTLSDVVCGQVRSPSENRECFNQYVGVLMKCIRLSYVDDSYEKQ